MGNKYTRLATKPTPQSRPIPGREAAMAQNSAGGYSFVLDKWKMLERFLILGAEGGTYYVKEQKLVADNIKSLNACIAEDPARVGTLVLDISVNGRAFKNDPAELALAQLVKTGGAARMAGWTVFPAVVRTGRTLLEFNILLDAMGVKWGSARRKAFASWYDSKTVDNLAYQVIKYPSASGWTHRDLLRLCHPKGKDALYRYIVGKEVDTAHLSPLVHGWEEIKKATTVKQAIGLIKDFNLTWEFVPGQFQGEKEVWQALLPNLPYTALIRNLGRMTSYGLLNGVDSNVKFVRDKLTSRDGLRKARVHPMTLLIAWRSYQSGTSSGAAHGRSNSLTWTQNNKISEVLEDAFYLAFDVVEPSNKDMLLGIDVSGSMGSKMSNLPISCSEAATVMAMISLRTEKNSMALGFDKGIRDMHLTKNDNFGSAFAKLHNVNGGGTDCAMPMIYALDNGLEFNQFVVLTDNETWAGKIHPVKALEKYREKTGIAARLVVCGMTSTGFSIAHPDDEGMLDIVGFSTEVPALISKFAQGL